MRLEQVIRSTMTEAMDMDGRLDQLVRAGLMPTSSLPLLKRAISRMHAGMSLQGAERDVMNMFISSMMFIVLGDDTVFNKARAGAKSYAAEEVELDENAPIVAHLTKRYGDNIRKSHVRSAASDFGVDASKLAKAVRTKLGKNMLGEEEQIDEISSDMAHRYLKGKRERDYDISPDGKSSKLKKPQSFGKMNKDMKSTARALKTIEKSKKANEEVEQTDEELKGDQHKIDANKNGKVDGHDFKLLRGKKK